MNKTTLSFTAWFVMLGLLAFTAIFGYRAIDAYYSPDFSLGLVLVYGLFSVCCALSGFVVAHLTDEVASRD
jgi:hypothetical protein